MRRVSNALMGLMAVLVVVGLSDLALAKKPNPQGKQAGKFVVLGNGWVLDTTTSLRWQQTPGAEDENQVSVCEEGKLCTLLEAWNYCEALEARLPGRKELESLLDLSKFNPALPDGHPFVDENGTSTVKLAEYWSASTLADLPFLAWAVDFGSGGLRDDDKTTSENYAWCVRGKEAFDGQNIVPPAP